MALMADSEGKPSKLVQQIKQLLSNPKNLIILFTLLAFVGYAAFQTSILLGAVKKLPPDFEWKQYIALNPDLQEAGIVSKSLAEHHYLEFGRAESRPYKPQMLEAQQAVLDAANALPAEYADFDKTKIPADFDWITYLTLNPDLEAAGVSSKAISEAHYVKFGMAEQRLYKAARKLKL